MKKITLFILLFFTIFDSFSQKGKKNYDEAFKIIEVWLEAQKDFELLPGISVAIVKDQDILWSGAFGKANVEDNIDATANTLCSICSISKLFTSVAIMKLYDDGKLRLDDELKDVLPWFDLKQQFADSGPITIRSLLTHSSGLPRQSEVAYWSAPDFPFPTVDEMKEAMKRQETLYPASNNFQYSNLALSLLGEVVAELSGMSYEEYVTKHILGPLKLNNTRPEMPKDFHGKELAIGYSALDRKLNREKVPLFDAKGITAAAGYSSNVLDLAKFASWQFRLRDTIAKEILKPSTLKNMHNVHWTDPDFDLTWGLGFSVYKGDDGAKWVGHGGSCPGYRSTLQLNLRSKMAYAVMINAGGTNPGKYLRAINTIMGKTEVISESESDVNLDDYVGFYSGQPWGSENYIGSWNGKLVSIRLPSDNPLSGSSIYKHIEGDTFKRIKDNGELGETMVFERDENGNVYRGKSHQNYAIKMK
ncbi:serine hydrolase domain-containing protein [uncultured Winogradskyella sp.]|uniref:serine hydrolase domain-containing protein n=1 Tax=uncultured Winogradskyella sp. TaxID=395353 RepID=UPI00261B0E61|nr:serine hydrolase domain-containing protein [uncultured Winogradskyella sp.]